MAVYLSFQNDLCFFENKNYDYVLGLDEVGRGCLAGPVVAACAGYAVGENHGDVPVRIFDSKKLSEKQKQAAVEWMQDSCVAYTIAEASSEEIDQINILQASQLAMQRSFVELVTKLSCQDKRVLVLIDGHLLPKFVKQVSNPQFDFLPIVKGDNKSFAIACAAIQAKVYRDRYMDELAKTFPHYQWHSNVGYPTKAHKVAIKEHGLTEHHRKSFRVSL